MKDQLEAYAKDLVAGRPGHLQLAAINALNEARAKNRPGFILALAAVSDDIRNRINRRIGPTEAEEKKDKPEEVIEE